MSRNPLLSLQHPQPSPLHSHERQVQASIQECDALQDQQVNHCSQMISLLTKLFYFTVLTPLSSPATEPRWTPSWVQRRASRFGEFLSVRIITQKLMVRDRKLLKHALTENLSANCHWKRNWLK